MKATYTPYRKLEKSSKAERGEITPVSRPQISHLLSGIECQLLAGLRMQNHSWRISRKLTEQTVKHKANLQIHGVFLYETIRAQYTVMISLSGASNQAQKVKTKNPHKNKETCSLPAFLSLLTTWQWG